MVCSYNPKTQRASMLSIPRDTFIGKNKSKATGYDKINSVYSNKGPEKTLELVNELTGMDIKYYVVVNNQVVIDLVNNIGGVYFDVPIDMNYDDKTQNLHIHLKSGYQKIDGDHAEQLLRFRHNNNGTSYPSEYGDNDFGRMKTQRDFMIEVGKQTLKLKNITHIKSIMTTLYQNVETNVTLDDIFPYVPIAGVAQDYNKLSFFASDEEETMQIVKEITNYVEDIDETGDVQNQETSIKVKNETKNEIKNQTNTTNTTTKKSKKSTKK